MRGRDDGDGLVLLEKTRDVGDGDLWLDLVVEDGDVNFAALIAACVVELFGADLNAALHARAEVGGRASERPVGANLDRRTTCTLGCVFGARDGPGCSSSGLR